MGSCTQFPLAGQTGDAPLALIGWNARHDAHRRYTLTETGIWFLSSALRYGSTTTTCVYTTRVPPRTSQQLPPCFGCGPGHAFHAGAPLFPFRSLVTVPSHQGSPLMAADEQINVCTPPSGRSTRTRAAAYYKPAAAGAHAQTRSTSRTSTRALTALRSVAPPRRHPPPAPREPTPARSGPAVASKNAANVFRYGVAPLGRCSHPPGRACGFYPALTSASGRPLSLPSARTLCPGIPSTSASSKTYQLPAGYRLSTRPSAGDRRVR